MFQTPPEAHHQPPEPPEQNKTKEQAAIVANFISEVLRLSYMPVMLVCILTALGFDGAAGFIVSAFGGAVDFEPTSAYKTLLLMLALVFVVNMVQYKLDDYEEKK